MQVITGLRKRGTDPKEGLKAISVVCEVSREEILGEVPMELEKQVEVSTFVFNSFGFMVDYGDKMEAPPDKEEAAGAYAWLYDDAVPVAKATRYIEDEVLEVV